MLNLSEIQTSAEQRMWVAVLRQAIMDYIFLDEHVEPHSSYQEARYFLLEDQVDFPEVCQRAGLACDAVRTELSQILSRNSREELRKHFLDNPVEI